MFAAEDFKTAYTTFAISASVFFRLEVRCIAGWCAVMSGATPVAATRSRATLSIAVGISWGGKRNGGKGSSDGNEELHSVNKISKGCLGLRRTRPTRKLR